MWRTTGLAGVILAGVGLARLVREEAGLSVARALAQLVQHVTTMVKQVEDSWPTVAGQVEKEHKQAEQGQRGEALEGLHSQVTRQHTLGTSRHQHGRR